MRIHLGRAVVATLLLAEVGAFVGVALCSGFLLAFVQLQEDFTRFDNQTILGSLIWGSVVGAPAGAIALPLLFLTTLRRTPLGRALAFSVAGAVGGLAVAAAAMPALVVWPVPIVIPALGLTGLIAGATEARTRWLGTIVKRLSTIVKERRLRSAPDGDSSA